MTRQHTLPSPRSNLGFSLIELLVALTLGLAITVAVISAYLGASGASRMADAEARMNEDAQAALATLTQQIRMAGDNRVQPLRIENADPSLASSRNPIYLPSPTYPGFTTTFALLGYRVRGCDGTFSNVTATTSIDGLNCAGGTTTLPDSIAVTYEADAFNTIPTTTTPTLPTDCLGSRLAGNVLNSVTTTLPVFTTAALNVAVTATATVTYAVAENRFYVGTSTAIVSPSLYCRGNGGPGSNGAPQPLVENIEDMQFMYGVVPSTASTTTTATVAGYLTADQVTSDVALNPLTVPQRWGKVVTVRLCVVVRSENPVLDSAASGRYTKCDGTTDTTQTDRRLRRAYSTTVVLRNPRLY